MKPSASGAASVATGVGEEGAADERRVEDERVLPVVAALEAGDHEGPVVLGLIDGVEVVPRAERLFLVLEEVEVHEVGVHRGDVEHGPRRVALERLARLEGGIHVALAVGVDVARRDGRRDGVIDVPVVRERVGDLGEGEVAPVAVGADEGGGEVVEVALGLRAVHALGAGPEVLLIDALRVLAALVEHVLARVTVRHAVERHEEPGVDAGDAVLPVDRRPPDRVVHPVFADGFGRHARRLVRGDERGAEVVAELVGEEDGLLGLRRGGGGEQQQEGET